MKGTSRKSSHSSEESEGTKEPLSGQSYQPIATASAMDDDSEAAVRSFCAAMRAKLAYPKLLIFFCSAGMDRRVVSGQLARVFSQASIIGCASEGVLGDAGYLHQCSISGMGFSDAYLEVDSVLIKDLNNFELSEGYAAAKAMKARVDAKHSMSDHAFPHSIGLLLMDGASKQEERISESLQVGLDQIPIVGGSVMPSGQGAGIFYKRRFYSDAAVLMVLSCKSPVFGFNSNHFSAVPDSELVVTETNVETRMISEIEGIPAVDALKELYQCDENHLQQSIHQYPFGMLSGTSMIIRSIKSLVGDQGIEMGCAIEEGSVLNVLEPSDLTTHYHRLMQNIEETVEGPFKMLTFDNQCREWEAERRGEVVEMGALMGARQVVGCTTTGEQFNGAVLNYSMSSIAFSING